MIIDVDAVVAGGGVAGSAAAAALAGLGWSVLIVEPGQHDERRLAGELIHPAGVSGLADLGLLTSPVFAAAARLDGFAVFPPGRAGLGAATGDCIQLPYERSGAGLALDHAGICQALLATVAALPRVTIARGWRVSGLDDTGSGPIVRIRRAGITETVRCRIVVAADGASSPVRTIAGLRHQRTRNAILTGYLVDREALPLPGLAHVFTAPTVTAPTVTAPEGPVLAYAIGNGRARVLFDRPLSPNHIPREETSPSVEALTPRLRAEVAAAMASGSGLRFVGSDVTVEGVARGRVVLVGDAAGTCHPITASGMTMGIGDAARLAQSIQRRDGDVPGALALYAAERRSRQRARILLAAMLHDVLCGSGPEMGLLRAGMHRYWSGSARARAASMSLLSMEDVRTRSILAEFLRVASAGFLASVGELASAGDLASLRSLVAMPRRAGLMARLALPMMRHLVGAMRVQ